MKTTRLSLFSLLAVVVGLTLSSCNNQEQMKEPKATVAPRAIIHTNYGDMTVEFWPDVAPRTVDNFLKLSRENFYNGTAFHRILKGFMIQGGCPNSKVGSRGQPGTGGPGYMVKAEFNNRPHVRGVLSMARSQDVDSAGSQFFVCHGNAAFLNNKYTAFGMLVGGDDVLNKIANVPCVGMEGSTPTERVEITSVEIVGEVSKAAK
jgi:peptidyl-prolyl cis-trans isomerase B (cyclophilin B)